MTSFIDEKTGQIRLFDPELVRCPQPAYAEIRSRCPVGRGQMPGWVVSRYDDVAWALRHPELFSSEIGEMMKLGNERPMIPQQIDPPAQTRYRRLLDPLFSRKRMAELVPAIRKHANQLIDAFADRGECEFDEAFAIPLPCTAFLALFGLPASEIGSFLEMKDGIIRPAKYLPPPKDDKPESFMAFMDEQAAYRKQTADRMFAYFEDEIARSQDRERNDLLGALLAAEIDGQRLSREEILDICFLLLIAGLDTVTATLGCSIAYLASNPDQRRRLFEKPELIPGAVEELMRWETPVTAVPRLVVQDTEIGGVKVRKGEMVTFLIGAANTDDTHFRDAQTVDFERERNIHMAFGAGPHRCLGSHLARMELQVAMEEWHRRIPNYRIKAGEQPTYSPGIREVMYLPLVWEA